MTRTSCYRVITPQMLMTKLTLSELETRICDWLTENFEPKLKDHFLADLSWAVDGDKTLLAVADFASVEEMKKLGYTRNREQAVINFFTKRMGKRVFEVLPEDIRNYVLANSL